MEQEKLGCSICLDLLKDPVTIPCGHSYCMNCIRSYWDGEDQKETHSCPQCRQTFRPRPDLVRNTVMADLVEEVKKTRSEAASADLCYAGPGDVSCDFCTGRKLKAVKSCLQCLVSFCDQHLQPHYQSPAFKKHQLVDPSKKLQENICSHHDEVMKMFCRTDQQCICYLCSLDEHRGHDTVSAAAERKDKQRELAEDREKIQQRIREKEEGVKVLQQEIAELRRRSSELELLSQTDDHIQFLQNYTLLGRLSEDTDSAVSDATHKPQDVLSEESTKSSQMNYQSTAFEKLVDPSKKLQGSRIDSPRRRKSSMTLREDFLIFNIVLLGKTGTGKSASGNTILTAVNPELDPSQLFVSRPSSIPVTSKCEVKEINVFGRQVRVVDTPDFFDEDVDSQVHLDECKKFCQPGNCVVLLVIQMGQFSDSKKGILEKLENMLGWRIRESTIVLLTHGENAKGQEQSFIAERTDLRPMMQACGNRYHVFENTLKKPKQVMELFKKIPDYETIFPQFTEKTSITNCYMS